MSVTIMSRVFWTEFSEISFLSSGKKIKISPQTSKIVMLVVADTANDYGENSWQSVNTIAYKASIKRRTAIRALKGLIANEYLFLDGKSKSGTNNFTINVDKLAIPPTKNTGIMSEKIHRLVTLRQVASVPESPESLVDSSELIIPSQKNLCEGEQKENPVCKDCLKLQEDINFIRSQGSKFEPMALRFEKQLADLKTSNTCGLMDEKRAEWAKEKDAPVSRESNIISAMFSGDEYADRVSIYPENVRKNLLLFVRKFEYPVASIPKKSKSKGGLYATWILGIEELQNIAGNRFEEVLDKAYEIWYNRDAQYKNAIDMPQKLKSLFITALSELKKQDAEKMKEEVEKAKLAENKKIAAPKQEEIDALKKFAKRLK